MIDEPLLLAGLGLFPFYLYLCAKIAARAWHNEKRRYHDYLMRSQ